MPALRPGRSRNSAKTVEAFAQTLQESEIRFRDVAEASSDWIWECDKDLRLIYFSQRFSQVTGIAAASVLGRSVQQFFSSDGGSNGWVKLLEDTQERHGVPGPALFLSRREITYAHLPSRRPAHRWRGRQLRRVSRYRDRHNRGGGGPGARASPRAARLPYRTA